MLKASRAVLFIPLGIASCSGAPSHIPPIWQLPGAAVSSGFENAAYERRRNAVKGHVSAYESDIVAEIEAGGGRSLATAMDLAGIPAEQRGTVLNELRSRPDIYRLASEPDRLDIEAVTVTLMVYAG